MVIGHSRWGQRGVSSDHRQSKELRPEPAKWQKCVESQ